MSEQQGLVDQLDHNAPKEMFDHDNNLRTRRQCHVHFARKDQKGLKHHCNPVEHLCHDLRKRYKSTMKILLRLLCMALVVAQGSAYSASVVLFQPFFAAALVLPSGKIARRNTRQNQDMQNPQNSILFTVPSYSCSSTQLWSWAHNRNKKHLFRNDRVPPTRDFDDEDDYDHYREHGPSSPASFSSGPISPDQGQQQRAESFRFGTGGVAGVSATSSSSSRPSLRDESQIDDSWVDRSFAFSNLEDLPSPSRGQSPYNKQRKSRFQGIPPDGGANASREGYVERPNQKFRMSVSDEGRSTTRTRAPQESNGPSSSDARYSNIIGDPFVAVGSAAHLQLDRDAYGSSSSKAKHQSQGENRVQSGSSPQARPQTHHTRQYEKTTEELALERGVHHKAKQVTEEQLKLAEKRALKQDQEKRMAAAAQRGRWDKQRKKQEVIDKSRELAIKEKQWKMGASIRIGKGGTSFNHRGGARREESRSNSSTPSSPVVNETPSNEREHQVTTEGFSRDAPFASSSTIKRETLDALKDRHRKSHSPRGHGSASTTALDEALRRGAIAAKRKSDQEAAEKREESRLQQEKEEKWALAQRRGAAAKDASSNSPEKGPSAYDLALQRGLKQAELDAIKEMQLLEANAELEAARLERLAQAQRRGAEASRYKKKVEDQLMEEKRIEEEVMAQAAQRGKLNQSYLEGRGQKIPNIEQNDIDAAIEISRLEGLELARQRGFAATRERLKEEEVQLAQAQAEDEILVQAELRGLREAEKRKEAEAIQREKEALMEKAKMERLREAERRGSASTQIKDSQNTAPQLEYDILAQAELRGKLEAEKRAIAEAAKQEEDALIEQARLERLQQAELRGSASLKWKTLDQEAAKSADHAKDEALAQAEMRGQLEAEKRAIAEAAKQDEESLMEQARLERLQQAEQRGKDRAEREANYELERLHSEVEIEKARETALAEARRRGQIAAELQSKKDEERLSSQQFELDNMIQAELRGQMESERRSEAQLAKQEEEALLEQARLERLKQAELRGSAVLDWRSKQATAKELEEFLGSEIYEEAKRRGELSKAARELLLAKEAEERAQLEIIRQEQLALAEERGQAAAMQRAREQQLSIEQLEAKVSILDEAIKRGEMEAKRKAKNEERRREEEQILEQTKQEMLAQAIQRGQAAARLQASSNLSLTEAEQAQLLALQAGTTETQQIPNKWLLNEAQMAPFAKVDSEQREYEPAVKKISQQSVGDHAYFEGLTDAGAKRFEDATGNVDSVGRGESIWRKMQSVAFGGDEAKETLTTGLELTTTQQAFLQQQRQLIEDEIRKEEAKLRWSSEVVERGEQVARRRAQQEEKEDAEKIAELSILEAAKKRGEEAVKRRAAAEARRKADEERTADAQQKRLAEATSRADFEKKRAKEAAAQRRKEEEEYRKKFLEDARRRGQAVARLRADEENKKKAAEEAKRNVLEEASRRGKEGLKIKAKKEARQKEEERRLEEARLVKLAEAELRYEQEKKNKLIVEANRDEKKRENKRKLLEDAKQRSVKMTRSINSVNEEKDTEDVLEVLARGKLEKLNVIVDVESSDDDSKSDEQC